MAGIKKHFQPNCNDCPYRSDSFLFYYCEHAEVKTMDLGIAHSVKSGGHPGECPLSDDLPPITQGN